MMLVAWRRAVDIIATRVRRIACIVNAVIVRRRGRLRIWRIVSLGDAIFLFFARPDSKRENSTIRHSSRSFRDLALIRSWAHKVLHMPIRDFFDLEFSGRRIGGRFGVEHVLVGLKNNNSSVRIWCQKLQPFPLPFRCLPDLFTKTLPCA